MVMLSLLASGCVKNGNIMEPLRSWEQLAETNTTLPPLLNNFKKLVTSIVPSAGPLFCPAQDGLIKMYGCCPRPLVF